MIKKVLIIDDDSRNIFALSAVLKAKGYSCLSALSAADGLSIIGSDDEVAVVLLDMMMPDMDGYEMLAHIRAGARSTLPVIAVTARAMFGDKERCLEAGANDYISKPIDLDLLIEVLKTYHVEACNSVGRSADRTYS